MTTTTRAAGAGATFLAAAAAIALVATPAVAAGAGADDVVVSNTETVQAYLDATGELEVARIYDQIAMTGQGTVDLVNPVSTQGLRNLDRFGGFEVEDGAMVGTYEVDGDMRLRAVSDFTKELPLEVAVTYLLDGEEVTPGDVVGKTGTLEVRYVVRNVTGKPREITFDDGTGKMVTATEDVVIPMVGSLSTVLPPSFTDVTSAEANMAGDGRGGTRMSFTMTLFGPIGKPEASFGYQARIADGVIPPASISALPVSPLDSPSFKAGAAAYESGATTGITLTDGATQIDDNLLKLRDGAGELLAGLIQLRDGAETLSAGLSGTAAPGAAQLADGASRAADGATALSNGVMQLDDGAGALSAGAGQLATGAGTAKSGADQLAGGSAQVADGLDQAGAQAPQLIAGLDQVAAGLDQVDAGLVLLYGGIGNLPAQAQPLHDGIQKLRAGIGSKTDVGTIIYGINAVNTALAGIAVPGIDRLIGSVYNTSPTTPGSYQRLDCAQLILSDVIDGTLGGGERAAGSTHPCYRSATNPDGLVPVLRGLTDTADFPAPGLTERSRTVTSSVQTSLEDSLALIVANTSNPNAPNDTTLLGGLNSLKIGLDAHAPGTYGPTDQGGAQYALTAVNCGLDNTTSAACDVNQPGVIQGLATLDAGITQLVNTVVATVQGAVGDDNDTAADKTLRGGVNDLEAGVDQLSAGGGALVLGLGQLSAGAKLVAEGNADLAAGLGTLSSGAGQISSGAGQLSDGAGRAAAGAAELADGNLQIADGAGLLADGLQGAADGSTRIADGLGTAADGAPALRDGAQQLSDEGTKKLIEAGKSTAADYGAKYALIEAGAERAQTEGMVYGAPENALASAAYSYEIAGADGSGGRNLGRGLAAAAIFGLAGGAVLLRRQML